MGRVAQIKAFALGGLRLSLSDFYALTPREYQSVFEAWKQQQKKEDHRIGLICAVMANLQAGKKNKSFTPEDFMPKELKAVDTKTLHTKFKSMMRIK